ncbi:hypothetical protein MTO96_040145 [Rhipicephalus appendiculatus]
MDETITTLPPATPLDVLNGSDHHVLLNPSSTKLPPANPLAALTSFLTLLAQKTLLGIISATPCNGTIEPCQAGVSDNASSATLLNHHEHSDYDSDGDTRTVEEVLAIAVPILFGAIAVIGFFGNALVVLVVLCDPQMRSTTNNLIINLAMADLLFIVFCVPFTGWDYTLNYWPFGDAWCRIVQYLVIVCAYASIYTLVLMSLDRFLAVVHPITSMSIRTERNANLAILFTWVVILAACVPALFAHGVVLIEDSYSACTFRTDMGYNIAAFQISFFMSSFVVPLAIVFVLYL